MKNRILVHLGAAAYLAIVVIVALALVSLVSIASNIDIPLEAGLIGALGHQLYCHRVKLGERN